MSDKIGKFIVAVGAIVEDPQTGKILLSKRREDIDFLGNIWEYTTRRMAQFEDPIEALNRGIMEEAGIEVEIVKPISVFHIFRGEKTAENELIGIMFWCKAKSTEIKLSQDHTDSRWVAVEEALEMITIPGMKASINAYIGEKK